jgi:hypothetical protein
MKGDLRCVDGRLLRHDPQHDDPDLETDIGECPHCSGDGCEREPDPGSDNPNCVHEWSVPSEEYDRVYCLYCGADGDA